MSLSPTARHRVALAPLQHADDPAGGVALEVDVGVGSRSRSGRTRCAVLGAVAGRSSRVERCGMDRDLVAPGDPDPRRTRRGAPRRRAEQDRVEHARSARSCTTDRIGNDRRRRAQASHGLRARTAAARRRRRGRRAPSMQLEQVIDHRPAAHRHEHLRQACPRGACRARPRHDQHASHRGRRAMLTRTPRRAGARVPAPAGRARRRQTIVRERLAAPRARSCACTRSGESGKNRTGISRHLGLSPQQRDSRSLVRALVRPGRRAAARRRARAWRARPTACRRCSGRRAARYARLSAWLPAQLAAAQARVLAVAQPVATPRCRGPTAGGCPTPRRAARCRCDSDATACPRRGTCRTTRRGRTYSKPLLERPRAHASRRLGDGGIAPRANGRRADERRHRAARRPRRRPSRRAADRPMPPRTISSSVCVTLLAEPRVVAAGPPRAGVARRREPRVEMKGASTFAASCRPVTPSS